MRPRYILLIAITAIIIIALVVIIFGRRPLPPKETQITFWGFEDEATLKQIFTQLASEQKIIVKYIKKDRAQFAQEFLEALAQGEGPDIFQLNHQQLNKYQEKILPAPVNIFTLQTYQSRFTDLAFAELTSQSGIWGVPLYLDTLALFYNKDFFNSMAIPQAPATWETFKDAVIILTQKDNRDNILRAGCAWGSANNVSYAADLVAALIIQSGGQMLSSDKSKAIFDQSVQLDNRPYRAGEKALEFYTNFADLTKEIYTWNRRMPNSLEAFSQAKAAMVFGYSQDLTWLKKESPYLNFGIAPFPQIAQADINVYYANFDILVVSNRSLKSTAAWQALEYLTQPENIKIFLSKARRPTPVRDLVSWQKEDLELGVFAVQALAGRSWYQSDPETVEEIFTEMIDSVVLKEAELDQAVKRAASKVTQTLR